MPEQPAKIPDQGRPSQGVFYIALGESYITEARRSIRSLKSYCPDLPVAVLTDDPASAAEFADIVIEKPPIDNEKGKTAAKPQYMALAPFERNLFIDSDTLVMEDISPVFGLLDHYDLAVHFEGCRSRHGNGLHYHVLCNSGVFLFKDNEVVQDCLRRYGEFYTEAYARAGEKKDHHGLRDQRFLALAIAESRARPCHLGDFMNFTLWEPNLANGPPAIVHGRYEPLEEIAETIKNSWEEGEWERRLWSPGTLGYLPIGLRNSGPLLAVGYAVSRLWNKAKYLSKK